MDYCHKCKRKTYSVGEPKFVKKNKRFRRISKCSICSSEKNTISKSPFETQVLEIHKPVRKNFQRRNVIMKGIDDNWQADLLDMRFCSKENDGYKYILLIIDNFSKYVFYTPLKSKNSSVVAEGFEKHLIERKPKLLHTDEGLEFKGEFLKMLEKHEIKTFHTQNREIKASIIERFNRTLNEKLKLEFSRQNNHRWIDVVSKLIHQYNHKDVHRAIGMKPAEVTKDKESVLLATVYNYQITKENPKYLVGLRVRIPAYRHTFRNKYKANWTMEIFVIKEVKVSNIDYYKIVDERGEDIEGYFTEFELLPTFL